MSQIDVTGWHTITELMDELDGRRIHVVIAGRRTEVRDYARSAGIRWIRLSRDPFPTLSTAVSSFRKRSSPPVL